MNPMLTNKQRKAAIRCAHCHRISMGGTVRTILDDSGSLAITAWKCESCGGVIEEIQILLRYGKAQPRRIRYAVSQQRRTRRLAPRKGAARTSGRLAGLLP